MLISPLYYVISGCQNEKDSCAVRGAPSAAARHLPRRGRGGFVGSKPDICTIHRSHPVEKDSSIAKIVQSYTIGGLRASVQGAPSAAARHLPRRGRGGFVGGKPDICAIHRCPSCKKNSSIAKIMQIYTIGGLRASKQTLAEQVSKACDSPPTHFCRSSEARFRSVSVFRRTSTRSLAKRGVCAEHADVTLCAHES